jgi:hypothetical protein
MAESGKISTSKELSGKVGPDRSPVSVGSKGHETQFANIHTYLHSGPKTNPLKRPFFYWQRQSIESTRLAKNLVPDPREGEKSLAFDITYVSSL